jgi:hypothetical protein
VADAVEAVETDALLEIEASEESEAIGVGSGLLKRRGRGGEGVRGGKDVGGGGRAGGGGGGVGGD